MFKQAYLWVLQDKFLFVVCFVLPLFLGILGKQIFIQEIPRKLPIVVIDLDKTTTSHQVIFELNATSAISVKYHVANLKEAKRFLNSAEVYGALVLPKDLERQIKMGRNIDLPFYYNAEYVLIGKTLKNAFLQTALTLDAKTSATKALIRDANLSLAKAQALPIITKLHALYNENNNYAQYLLSVVLPCMWQILVAVGMLNFIQKVSNMQEFLWSIGANASIFGCFGIVMVLYFNLIGMQGNYKHFLLVVLAIGLMTLIMSGFVVLVYAVLKDAIKVASVVAGYTAPSLAFAGVTYPQNNMEMAGNFWSHFLPISHFMKFFLQEAYYKPSLTQSLHSLLPLLPFLIFLLLGIFLFARFFKKHSNGVNA
ncbi:ABC transporter permease [Helicobacter cetorum]|uniref:ABC transporter permease n=1 Tax=Helicobacter cetorum TaxID=138563 RepID=UPI000CF02DFF|nr:ABC transporter permease [Helicobacter cetorum]